MRIASEEVRSLAVKAYESGTASRELLAKIFCCSVCSLGRWIREARSSGRLAPRPRGHMPPAFSQEELAQLAGFIDANPGATLEEIRARFGKRCSLAAVFRAVAKLGYTVKKNLGASEQDREDVRERRREWAEAQAEVPAERLVFLDESGAKTNMTRLYGRSPKGTRCRCKAPDGRWERLTMLSAVRLDGSTESIVFEGALNRAVFDGYIRDVLAPTLRPGDVLVLDNLNVHKSPAMLEAVHGRGATVMFLPPYSPDMNPIEKMWSKVKAALRMMEARTKEELFHAVAAALAMVTAADAEGWFGSCGYIAFQK